MTAFYVLERKTAVNFAYLDTVLGHASLSAPTCPHCGVAMVRKRDCPTTRYILNDRLPLGDLLTAGTTIAVSARFADAYRQSGLQGLDIGEPILTDKPQHRYYVANPIVNCTLLDEEASGVEINNLRGCNHCRVMSMRKIDRVVIRRETWSGEDIFCSSNLFSEIIATQRFVDFVHADRFTNFQLLPSESFHFDYRAALRNESN